MTLHSVLFIFALAAAAAARSANERHFWKLLEPAVGHYAMSEESDEETGAFRRFHVHKGESAGEHVIDVAFAERKDGVHMKFFYSKKDDVEKVVPHYDPAEMALQAAVLPTFVHRMSTTVDQKSRHLYFNMIQDIREELLTIGDRSRLVFEENSAEDQTEKGHVRINLRYSENLLGVFVITPTLAEDVHVLRVDFNISRSRAQSTLTGSLSIPVLTDKKNALKLALADVVSVLQLRNHVNCNQDNFRELVGFLKSFRLITFVPGASETPALLPFTLRSGEDVATGFLTYPPPAPDTTAVGRFRIEISMGGKVEIEAEFERMTIPEFRDFLESLNIGRLFQSLWEKIQAIFKEQMAATFPAEQRHKVEYADSESSSGFLGLGTTQYSLQSTLDDASFATLSFKDDSSEPRLRFKTDLPSAKIVEMRFQRAEFRKDAVALFVRGFRQLMAEARQSNWAGRASRVRKVRA